MSSSTLAETAERRLHPAGMLLAALATVRRWFGLAAFPGIAALLNGEFGMRTLLLVLLGIALIAVFSAVWGVLSWRATTYRVSGGAFHFKQGVLQKSERSLPLERIQSVDSIQGVVQRVFGVVGVRIEAAGGGGEPEISLSALSRPAAGALREELTRSTRRASTEVLDEPALLRSLAVRDLLLAGVTLSRSPDGKYLHISRGLLERHESTVPLARIQAIRVVEGVLRQPFGLASLRVESAGFGAETGV